MSEEKSYGQIGEEAYQAMCEYPREWEALRSNWSQCEAFAQAVIAEFLRRSGEPVGWQWFDGDEWKACSYFVAHGFKDELSKDCRAVYAAPQPLPSMEKKND